MRKDASSGENCETDKHTHQTHERDFWNWYWKMLFIKNHSIPMGYLIFFFCHNFCIFLPFLFCHFDLVRVLLIYCSASFFTFLGNRWDEGGNWRERRKILNYNEMNFGNFFFCFLGMIAMVVEKLRWILMKKKINFIVIFKVYCLFDLATKSNIVKQS